MIYDVIIAGSGLGGLTAGALLAKSGYSVLILEKNTHIGGACGSFKTSQNIYDISLHNFGPYYEHKVLYDFFTSSGLDKMTEFIPYTFYQRLKFPEHDIKVPKGMDNFISELTTYYPEESKGLKKISKLSAKIFKEFNELQLNSNDMEYMRLNSENMAFTYPNIALLSSKSLASLLSDYISNPQLTGIIANLWWLFGMPITELSAVLYMSPFYGYFEYGGGIFKRTSQSLVNGLSQIISENGGVLHTGKEISSIRFIGECEVRTSTGEIYFAKKVLSDCGADITFNTLIQQKTPEQSIIEKVPSSLSAVSIFLGLDPNTDVSPSIDHSLTLFSSYDQQKNYEYSTTNNFEKSTLLISAPQTHTATFKSSYVNLLTLCDASLPIDKSQTVSILTERFFSIYPHVRKSVTETRVFFPDDFHSHTGIKALYGYAQSSDFSGIKRFSNITSLPDLFLTGKDTFPGAGYASVMVSGIKAFEALRQTMEKI